MPPIQRPQRLGQERHIARVAVQQEGMPLRLLMRDIPAVELRPVGGREMGVLRQDGRLVPFARRIFGRLKNAAALQPRRRRVGPIVAQPDAIMVLSRRITKSATNLTVVRSIAAAQRGRESIARTAIMMEA